MRAKILNRGTNEPPKDGWYQIEVNGTWPAGAWPDGRKRRQVIDDKAVESIVNRFNQEKAAAGSDFAGMLVDLDHLSHDPENSTEAYAWLHDVEIRNRQLWGRLDLTDLGEPAVRNKRLKWFSTEYNPEDVEDLGDGSVRPLRLSGLAFTNRPNNRGGKPISNRSGDEPGQTPTPQNKAPMKSIAEKLGLPADADEPTILAKLTTVLSENEAMKTKDAETQADAVMNSLGKNIPQSARAHWRQELITNRAKAEDAIKLSFPLNPPRGGEKPIFNRDGANTPEPVEGGEGEGNGASPAEAKKAAAIRNRAHAIQASEGIPFGQAFNRAKEELR